jgi:hypothetical protein
MKIKNLFFWTDWKACFFIIYKDESEYFGVKLNEIKTSFSVTCVQILCHVTVRWGRKGCITMFEELDIFSYSFYFKISRVYDVPLPNE